MWTVIRKDIKMEMKSEEEIEKMSEKEIDKELEKTRGILMGIKGLNDVDLSRQDIMRRMAWLWTLNGYNALDYANIHSELYEMIICFEERT